MIVMISSGMSDNVLDNIFGSFESNPKKGARKLLDSGAKALLFLSEKEKMDSDNYIRAFREEIQRLGEDCDDEAVKVAKSREPEGYEATMKWARISEEFEKNE